MTLPPIGFWSYTRDDDVASGRRLSGLLESLQAQLKQKLGKLEVRVFQDVSAIPPGTEWQTQIESALREASFLIPIITPALLHSPNCAEEIRYFRTLMEARGRKDLIMPICFTDVYPDSPEIRKTSCQPAARRFCSAHDPRWLP